MTATSNPSVVKMVDTTPREAGEPESNDAGEFDRFKDLAGKVVQVPKSEVDEKRKKP
jgi:hypothetical protein